jgi:hypothetical protein
VRVFVVSLLLLLGFAANAAAATFDVTSSADSGPGTLRQALSQAASGDRVTFSTAGPIALGAPLLVRSGVDIEGCSDPGAVAPCVRISGSSSFDAIDIVAAGTTLHGLAISGAAVGIHVGASLVTVGGASLATENSISGSAGPAILVDGVAANVVIDRNIGQGNGGPFIMLAPGANGGVQPPQILTASDHAVVGLATPGATVRLFDVLAPGSVAALAGEATAGEATADGSGVWEAPAAASPGELVAATQTGGDGTSALSVAIGAAHSPAGGPPVAAIGGPRGLTYTASPAFALSAGDPSATILCRLDAQPYAPCGATYATPPLAEGPHTIYARAAGIAGLGPETSRSFEVDLAQPGTIVSGPPRFGNRSYAAFRFTVAAGTVSTTCALDDQALRPCSQRFATGYMLDGRHLFHLRTSDAAGEAYTLDTVFTVDTLPPGISLHGARVRLGAGGTVAFAVTCPLSEPGGCTGALQLTTRPARRRRPRTVAAAAWQAGPGVAQAISIAVPSWAQSAALNTGGLPVRVIATARDDAGNVTVIRRNGTMERHRDPAQRHDPRVAGRGLRLRTV